MSASVFRARKKFGPQRPKTVNSVSLSFYAEGRPACSETSDSVSVSWPMRLLVGRSNWRPSVRIEGLRRYAFIGDSFAYGTGVAPDQTLPSNAERQMNELMPACPVEAVNFGVAGYNLWN